MNDPKLETIGRIYEAFGRGDVETILEQVTDDVDWAPEAAGTAVPWYGHYRGKAEVPQFFARIGSSIDVTKFQPLSFTVNDTDVMVVIDWAFRVRSTGKEAGYHLHHWWRFDGDKVASYRGTEDTAATIEAFTA